MNAVKKPSSGAGLTSSNSRNDDDPSDVEFMFRPGFRMRASRRLTQRNEVDDDSASRDSDQEDNDSSSDDGNPPLTYLTIQTNPSVLTRFANSFSACRRSIDGLVGSMFPGDILVTSPNSNLMFYPPLGSCRVRMRRDNRFGCHDPLLYPQPFSSKAPHLAIIRMPSHDTIHRFYTAWVVPDDSHFTKQHRSIGSGLGTLEKNFCSNLEVLAKSVLNQVLPALGRLDEFVRLGSTEIKRLLDRIHLPASRKELFLRVACLQRQILELDARIRWLGPKWRARRNDAEAQTKSNIIGAFTEDLKDLDLLFCSGIPVWFVRHISQTPKPRIERFAVGKSEDPLSISFQSSYQSDCRDVVPAHRVIYDGPAAKPERYFIMATHIRSLFNYSSFFGPLAAPNSASLSNAHNAPSYSTPETLFPPRLVPYSMQQRNRPFANPTMNLFLEPISPLIPPSAPVWETSLKKLWESCSPRNEIKTGYYLPPPHVFVTRHDAMACNLIHGWLRIREPVLYLLASLTCDSLCLSCEEWHALLDANAAPSSEQGRQHTQMMSILETHLKQGSVRLNREEEGFPSNRYRRQWLPHSKLPDVFTCQRILWEVNELNFRQDLISLDCRLAVDREGRRDMLDACWVGSADNVEDLEGDEGLAAKELQDRIPFLRALHQVMSAWSGLRPTRLAQSFPDPQDDNFDREVKHVEKALANFYASSFLDVFNRAASIPRVFLQF